MSEVAPLLASWVVSIVLLFALLRWDESQLAPEQLARAWPPATRTLAIVYFSAFSLPVHGWRTRRSWAGLFRGCDLAIVVLIIDELVAIGAEDLVKHFVAS
jgi:hypothetical protein